METVSLYDYNLFWMLLKLNIDIGDTMEGWTPKQKRLWSAITVIEQEKEWQVSIAKHLHESGRKAILKRLKEVSWDQEGFILTDDGCCISKAHKYCTAKDKQKFVVAWIFQTMARQYQDLT